MGLRHIAFKALAARGSRHDSDLIGLAFGMKRLGLLPDFADNSLGNAVRCKATEAYCNAIFYHGSALGCRQSSVFHKGCKV